MFAGGAFLGMYLSYGFDLRQKKKIADAHGYSGDEILRMLEESSRIIRSIEQANDKIRNTEFNQRIEHILRLPTAFWRKLNPIRAIFAGHVSFLMSIWMAPGR